MAIRLGKVEREYLKKLLNKHHSTWWPHKKWLNALKQEKELEEEKILCNHNFGEYAGRKISCTYSCGATMRKEWTLTKRNIKKQETRPTGPPLLAQRKGLLE